MIFELIHTSARRGLKPGSRGFTTVAHTRGMSPTLIEALESMSGYRFEFSPAGPDADRNPVIRMHSTLGIGGQGFHLLSRLGPAGADYTGRANRIAHHIAISDCTTLAAGPAWLLAQPQLFPERWDGEPRLLDALACLPDGEVMPERCGRWATVTGDAGWAGELVRRLRHDQRTSVAVLLPEGADRLSMMAELLSLLLPRERWTVTFATGAPRELPDGAKCRLHLVPATPQARRALAASRRDIQTLDLTGPAIKAPESDEAASARSGMAIKPGSHRSTIPDRRHTKPKPSFAEGTEITDAASVGTVLPRFANTTVMRVAPGRRTLWKVLAGLGLVVIGYTLGQLLPFHQLWQCLPTRGAPPPMTNPGDGTTVDSDESAQPESQVSTPAQDTSSPNEPPTPPETD